MTSHLIPAANLDIPELTATFNRAYEGYYVPITLTEQQIEQYILTDSIDLAASQVAQIEQGESVGVCLLAINGQRGWVGGMGVATDYRRQGIGRQLMTAILATARDRQLTSVQLEVLTQNSPAKTLYESLGFETTRQLLILSREPGALPPSVPLLQTVSPEDVLSNYDLYHPVPNPWQRDLPVLTRMTELGAQIWRSSADDAISAYVLGFASDETIALLDAACLPGAEYAMQQVIVGLHALYPQATARLVNIPSDDPVTAILQAAGYTVSNQQYEMRYDLHS